MSSKKKNGQQAKASADAPGDIESAAPSFLPSLAASGESPRWLRAGTDADRWDTLFSDESPEAPAELPDGENVQLQDADIDAEALEPELSVTADDVALEDPDLAPVEISNDAAHAAELDAVAEEARRVADEAEEAGRLVGGAPVQSAKPAEPAKLTKPAEPAKPAEPPKPAEQVKPAGPTKPAEPASETPDAPSSDTANADTPGSPRSRPRGNHSAPVKTNYTPLILVGLAILAAIALIIFIVVSLFTGGDEPAANKSKGVIDQEVSPLDLKEGQCLRGFEDINSEVTVVTCETPHNAQLVATFDYPADAEYPGKEALRAKAAETCESADLNTDAIRKYEDLRQTEASPGETTWENGDRRVDCYVFTDQPDALVESLLAD